MVPEELAAKHGAALARLFSAPVIKNLAATGHSALATQVLRESGFHYAFSSSISLSSFFEYIFQLLLKYHRNEYIYKNAIANRILLGRHSLNSSFMLTEFRVLNCKADCIVLNGTSNVYEIKSAFDTMVRLSRQIDAYQKIFDRVHVITSPEQLEPVMKQVDESVGVMVLNSRNRISTVREGLSNKAHTVPAAIFDSLRQSEYLKILRGYLGFRPDAPNTRIYKMSKDLFCKLPPHIAHDAMVQVLKDRGNCHSLKQFILQVPFSLKAACIACRLTGKEQKSFIDLLHSSAKGCLLAH